MKKYVTAITVLLLIVCSFALFTACDKDGDKITYTVDGITYSIGDTYSADDAKIVAVFGEDKYNVDQNLYFDDAAMVEAAVEDGVFTKEGTYEVKVYALEDREDLFIGTWVVTVK